MNAAKNPLLLSVQKSYKWLALSAARLLDVQSRENKKATFVVRNARKKAGRLKLFVSAAAKLLLPLNTGHQQRPAALNARANLDEHTTHANNAAKSSATPMTLTELLNIAAAATTQKLSVLNDAMATTQPNRHANGTQLKFSKYLRHVRHCCLITKADLQNNGRHSGNGSARSRNGSG